MLNSTGDFFSMENVCSKFLCQDFCFSNSLQNDVRKEMGRNSKQFSLFRLKKVESNFPGPDVVSSSKECSMVPIMERLGKAFCDGMPDRLECHLRYTNNAEAFYGSKMIIKPFKTTILLRKRISFVLGS